MRRVSILFIGGIVIVLSFGLTAAQATLYVDDNGVCDGNLPCYPHPQDAVNAAVSGDTVLVYPGTYGSRYFECPWAPNCSCSDNYSPALIVYTDDLTIQSVEGPTNTTIESTHTCWSNAIAVENSTANGVTGVSGWNPSAVTVVANNVNIDGFTLRRPLTCANTNDCFWNTAGVFIGSKGAGYQDFLGNANGATVKNNLFSDVWNAVYIWHSQDNLIVDNTVSALGSTGHWAAIQSYDGWDDASVGLSPPSSGTVISRNVLADKGIGIGAWDPPTPTDNSDVIVSCNTATEIGTYYSSGLKTFACNKNPAGDPITPWTASASDVANIDGVSYTGPYTAPVGPVTLSVQVSYSEIEPSVDGSGFAVAISYDDTVVDLVTGVGGTASTTVNLPPGVYTVTVSLGDYPCDCDSDTATLAVYDPSAGFVTGGGWIDSPACAYMPDVCQDGTFFMDEFDSSPPLSDAATDGAWYPDRYPPAAFESTYFDGDNRLLVHIDADDYLPYGSTFYNYQGRKFNLWNGLNTYITADLYIGPDWETNQRHASLWATTYDEDDSISGYPIAGFTAGTGFRIYTQDLDQDESNGYQPGWHDIGYPDGFSFGAWYTLRVELTETAYLYYINGQLVWTDIATFDSVEWANLMLQAYNYGEDYDVYWDRVGAGHLADSVVGKANFGFVAKYNKKTEIAEGNTEFVFKAGDLNFHSSSYDWLVVNKNDLRAQFKGMGTVNGAGEYKFMLWAVDDDPIWEKDLFRIKIWTEDGGVEDVLYDNGAVIPEFGQPLGGGNIVVHTKK